MSNVYNLEPPTQGKVVLRTSLGDIDLELWPKEAPKAVRNFVQLCLEGYYDGTLFHRVIKDFMAQGGDPTGTGEGGDSIYGRPFRDEFHPRLRFAHRGLLACANRNAPDTNGSQFFISLDRADSLDRKYTIFGKVTGDTIYNVARFNELEVDEATDRPIHPPTITRADVLWNPFEDIVPRVDRDRAAAAAAAAAATAEAEARAARKAGARKNFSLISFGEEAEEEEEEAVAAAAQLRIRSAHDALEDERLSSQAALEVDLDKVRAAMRAARTQQAEAPGGSAGPVRGGEGGGEGPTGLAHERMRQRVAAGAKRKAAGEAEPAARPMAQPGAAHAAAAPAAEEEEAAAAEERGEEEGGGGSGSDDGDSSDGGGKPSALAALGRGTKSSAAVVVPRSVKVENGELLTDWERKRKEYQERRRLGGHREKETLAKLARFKQGLKQAPAAPAAAAPAAGQPPAPAAAGTAAAAAAAAEAGGGSGGGTAGEAGYAGKVRPDMDHRLDMPAAWRVDDYLGEDDGSDDDLTSLRQHTLAFARGAKDAMARSDDIDDYTVHDPLLEKGKEKFNKKAAAAKKAATEWGGGGGGGGGERGARREGGVGDRGGRRDGGGGWERREDRGGDRRDGRGGDRRDERRR